MGKHEHKFNGYGLIQTVKTFYGGDTSQVDRKRPQENRKVIFSDRSVFGKEDSMVYSNTASHNSDIAAMSDFSDDEDWSQGELQPSILTVGDDSIRKEWNNCDELGPNRKRRQGLILFPWTLTIRIIGLISVS